MSALKILALAAPAAAMVNLVPHNHAMLAQKASYAPSNTVTMQYGGANTNYLNVSLATTHPAILLEDLATVTQVDCDDYSVAVKFNSSVAFAKAVSEWKIGAGVGKSSSGAFSRTSKKRSVDSLLFITNHLGDCDAELERGFFLAEKITVDNSTMTINATTTKQTLNETSSNIDITFSKLPQVPVDSAAHKRRRDVNGDVNLDVLERDLSWSPSFDIGHTVELAETSLLDTEYVDIIANDAYVGFNATVSGHISYNFWKFKLDAFTLDLDALLAAELELTVGIGAGFSETPKYTAPALEYDVVNVPGILSIGPQLVFDVGVELAAKASVTATTVLTASIPDGNVHIDLVDQAASSATGWVPTFTHNITLNEEAHAQINPFIDVTVGIACRVLGGLLDLGVNLVAQPKFNNDLYLSASQTVDTNNTAHAIASTASSATCPNGVEIDSDFEFTLSADVTQFWSTVLYNNVWDIADECYRF